MVSAEAAKAPPELVIVTVPGAPVAIALALIEPLALIPSADVIVMVPRFQCGPAFSRD